MREKKEAWKGAGRLSEDGEEFAPFVATQDGSPKKA